MVARPPLVGIGGGGGEGRLELLARLAGRQDVQQAIGLKAPLDVERLERRWRECVADLVVGDEREPLRGVECAVWGAGGVRGVWGDKCAGEGC